jgi:hypothetical protein
VFDHEPRVGIVAARDARVNFALEGERFAVRAPPEIEQPRRDG